MHGITVCSMKCREQIIVVLEEGRKRRKKQLLRATPTPAASKAGLQSFHFACSFLLSPPPPKLPERGRSFSRPVSHILLVYLLSSLSLSRSLSICLLQLFGAFFFFSFFLPFSLFLKDSVPASPRLPTSSSFNSSSTSVFVIFLSYRTYHLHTYNIRAALGIRLFLSPRPTIGTIPGVYHIYLCSTGTSQQQIPTPFDCLGTEANRTN